VKKEINFKPIQLKPIEKLVLIDLIIEELGKLIAEGFLKPGDALPGERELSEMLKVSRTSVRQALKALDVLGVLDIRPGSRTCLNKSISKLLINPMKFMSLLHDVGDIELFETRKIIEVELTRLAAKNASEEDLESIEGFLAEAEKNLDNPDKYLYFEMKFHDSIFKTSGNRILTAMMSSINNLLLKSREKTVMFFKDNLKKSLNEHKNIFFYIKEKDPEKAGKAMLEHLDKIEELISE